MTEPNSRKLSQRSLWIISERKTTMDQCADTHECVMVNFRFALHPIPCLHSVYSACSHTSQAPLTEALARLPMRSNGKKLDNKEKGKAGVSCPFSRLHWYLAVTVSLQGLTLLPDSFPHGSSHLHPCLRLVPVSVQWHWWLVSDNSSLSSSLSNNKTSITFSLLIISGMTYCSPLVFSMHCVNSYLN